jgi:general secretion pathway protein J
VCQFQPTVVTGSPGRGIAAASGSDAGRAMTASGLGNHKSSGVVARLDRAIQYSVCYRAFKAKLDTFILKVLTQTGLVRSGEAGFTLIEALVAITLMGAILTSLAIITAQWLPNWNRGGARLQRGELLALALDRAAADLGAAEFITPDRLTNRPLFDGGELAVTFVRSAIGPNTKPGLEIVRLAETSDRQGLVTVRSRAPYTPFATGAAISSQIDFTDPVVLMRAPYRLSFAYAGRDDVWMDTWRNAAELPATVRLTVRDTTTGRTLALTTATAIHVTLPASCAALAKGANCANVAAANDLANAAQRNSVPSPSPGPSPSP